MAINTNENIYNLDGTLNRENFIECVKALNGDKNIRIKFNAGESGEDHLWIDKDEICLPDTFEFNNKNSITNKHHSPTGAYVCISVTIVPAWMFNATLEDVISYVVRKDKEEGTSLCHEELETLLYEGFFDLSGIDNATVLLLLKEVDPICYCSQLPAQAG